MFAEKAEKNTVRWVFTTPDKAELAEGSLLRWVDKRPEQPAMETTTPPTAVDTQERLAEIKADHEDPEDGQEGTQETQETPPAEEDGQKEETPGNAQETAPPKNGRGSKKDLVAA